MKLIPILCLTGMMFLTGCTFDNNDKNKSSNSNIQKSEAMDEISTTELIKKLSMLNKNTSKTELINIFEQEPYEPIETDSDIYEYFIGDIHICLWGDPLFQVTVSVNDYTFSLDLEKEIDEFD